MSQPIRVEGWAYTPGARVNLRLRFRSQSTYARVKAQFHNPSGGVIKLQRVALILTRARHVCTIGRVDFSAEPPVRIMRYWSTTLKSADS
jgi:hypothetical protein